MTRRPAQKRPAVTLIEMLTVISIIGVLTALSVGTFVRLRVSQTVANSEGTLSKLHGLMATRWGAVLGQAEKTVPQDLVVRCDGDKDRAKALWTYATLKNEFPMSFAEATTPITLGGTTLQPRKIFGAVATPAAIAAGFTPAQQSAALFHAAITQGGNAGNVADADGTEPQVGNVTAGGQMFPVYVDGWGEPVAFVRHAGGAGTEVNGPPFTRGNKVRLGTTDATVLNSMDPQGRLSPWGGSPEQNAWLLKQTLLPGTANSVRVDAVLSAGYPTTFAPWVPIRYDQNTVPTLVSGGPNKKMGVNYADILADDSADNLLSYRLRREGDKGN